MGERQEDSTNTEIMHKCLVNILRKTMYLSYSINTSTVKHMTLCWGRIPRNSNSHMRQKNCHRCRVQQRQSTRGAWQENQWLVYVIGKCEKQYKKVWILEVWMR